jgi:hypothetical protein
VASAWLLSAPSSSRESGRLRAAWRCSVGEADGEADDANVDAEGGGVGSTRVRATAVFGSGTGEFEESGDAQPPPPLLPPPEAALAGPSPPPLMELSDPPP